MVSLKPEVSSFLDSTRGLAAITVLFAHVNQFFISSRYGNDGINSVIWGYSASCAVIAFFIVSGFVIAMSIHNSMAAQKEKWFYDFMLRRIARIYPPFIFSLFLTLAICTLIYVADMHGKYSFHLPADLYTPRESIIFEWSNYLKTLFMLSGFVKTWSHVSMNGPLWSISCEFWMYIFASLTAYLIARKNHVLAYSVIFTVTGWQLLSGNYKFLFFSSIWLIGFILFFVRDCQISKKNHTNIFCLIIACVGSMLYLITRDTPIFIPYGNFSAILFQFLLVIVSLYFIYYFKCWEFKIFRVFESTARYSYTLYVIQFPLLLLYFSLFHLRFSQSGFLMQVLIISGAVFSIIFISSYFSIWLENSKRYYKKMVVFSNFGKSRLGGMATEWK